MGLTLETSLPAITVFLQGLISFFSPCVLPLVPLYIGYLSGGARVVLPDGTISYPRKRVMLNTLFFVLGISFAFLLLGLGVSAAGRFFSGNKLLFVRLGGVIIILFGLYQLGVFGKIRLLSGEHRLPLRLDRLAMNPVTALVLGFTFSFAWTPCVGPALASVLIVASSAAKATTGYLLIGVYTLGFVLPFLGVGLFTGQLLELFKKHRNVVNYTAKAGGVLMIVMGVMMFTGWMNGLTGYLSSFGAATAPPPASQSGQPPASDSRPDADSNAQGAPPASSQQEPMPAPDFTLLDQYGNSHTLSDYKGKVVFLNFWATWCTYCVKEMPEIEELYQEYGLNAKDVVIMGIANPRTAENPQGSDLPQEEIEAFLEERGFTYPTVFDPTGEIFAAYGISSFPTTFMIDGAGNVFGYVPGQISKDMMQSIIKQTQDGGVGEAPQPGNP